MRHHMNGLLIAVLIILIGFMIWGYWRGFVRIVFSLAAMLLMIALVSWATPYITDFLKENTTIYEDLTDVCSEKIQLSAEEKLESAQKENTLTAAGDDTAEKEKEKEDGIAGLMLPELWAEQLLEKTGDTVNQVMEKNGLYRQAGAYIADWILRGVAFFTAFILISIVLKLIVGLLDIMTKLPLIKGVNRLLGGAVGLVQGLIVVWLLLFLVALTCTSQLGETMLAYIEDNVFLTYLYQHNGILYFFDRMFG